MPLIFIVIVIMGGIGLYIYHDNKKKKDLPKKIVSVKNLIEYLNHTKIEVRFCEYNADEGISCITEPVSFNFFCLIRFNSKILNDQYEDDKVLFNPDSNQFFHIERFSKDTFLPNHIMEELLNFNNTKFKAIEFNDNDQTQRFVNIRTGLWQGIKFEGNEDLIESETNAFESWQNLKDCAEQLEFVIIQWLKDAEVNDGGNNFGILNKEFH